MPEATPCAPPYYPFLEERATLEVIEARKWGSPGNVYGVLCCVALAPALASAHAPLPAPTPTLTLALPAAVLNMDTTTTTGSCSSIY